MNIFVHLIIAVFLLWTLLVKNLYWRRRSRSFLTASRKMIFVLDLFDREEEKNKRKGEKIRLNISYIGCVFVENNDVNEGYSEIRA